MVQINGFVDIAPNVKMGEHCIVWPFTTICSDVEIGDLCTIGGRCFIGKGAKIGDHTSIGDSCALGVNMVVGNGVFMAPHVVILGDRYPRINNTDYLDQSGNEPVIIEDDVSIGGNVTILSGVRLGRGCLIGAGAMVTKDVPSEAIVAGNPARIIRYRDDLQGVKL